MVGSFNSVHVLLDEFRIRIDIPTVYRHNAGIIMRGKYPGLFPGCRDHC